MIMGVTRSAYIARCKFHSDRPAGLIRFYFVPESHERFLEPTVFYPWKEYQQYRGNLPYGERVNSPRPWDPGTDHYGQPGTASGGPLEHFLGRSPFDPSLPCCGTACFLHEVGTGFHIEHHEVPTWIQDIGHAPDLQFVLEDGIDTRPTRAGVRVRSDLDVTSPPQHLGVRIEYFEVYTNRIGFYFQPWPVTSGSEYVTIPGIHGGAIPLWTINHWHIPIIPADLPYVPPELAEELQSIGKMIGISGELTEISVDQQDLGLIGMSIAYTDCNCELFELMIGMELVANLADASVITLDIGMKPVLTDLGAALETPGRIGLKVSLDDNAPPLLTPGLVGMSILADESCEPVVALWPNQLTATVSVYTGNPLGPQCENLPTLNQQFFMTKGNWPEGIGWRSPDLSDPNCDDANCNPYCDPWFLLLGCDGSITLTTGGAQWANLFPAAQIRINSYSPASISLIFGTAVQIDITE